MTERLPIYDVQDDIVAALLETPRLVLCAPTGSGKSTQVPQMLLAHGLLGEGQVVTLQPRRMAARMLASRVAGELGVPLGQEVGYRVRLDHRASQASRIVFETEGILLRRLADDPGLRGIRAVIFDEFHERHLYGDITLARVRDLQETRRPDLLIIVMSATIDTGPLAAYLDPCTVLRSEGRTFPVDIEYLSTPTPRGQRPVPVWEQAADAFAREARRGEHGDVLVFMPGAYEIHRTIRALGSRPEARGYRLLPLHGRLPPADQDAAVAPGSDRRVVVATNVAETSITIESVGTVIDSGLARVLRYDPNRGINTLLIAPISRASADQRAGRAGRTAAGRAIRLWSRSDQRGRAASDLPEVQRLDLSEVVLTLKAAGVDLEGFRWLDRPSATAVAHAESLLAELGALAPGDAGSAITDLGRRMLAFPIHPRYARMLVAAADTGSVRDACLVAALTQGRDILVHNPGPAAIDAREEWMGSDAGSDFWTRMRAWDYAVGHRFDVRALDRVGIHAGAAREVGPLFDQFLEIARDQGLDVEPRETRFADLGRAILTGFSDRVGRRPDDSTPRCALVGGRRGRLEKESVVRSPLFVAAEIREVGRGRGEVETRVSLATPIEAEWLAEFYPDEIHSTVEVRMDAATRRLRAERQSRFRDLVLDSTDIDPPPEDAARALADEVMSGRFRLPLWNHSVTQWISRLNFLASSCPELGLPRLTDADRRAILEQLCLGATSYGDLKDRPVLPVVRSWLAPSECELVDRFAPERVTLSNGRNPKLVYEDGQPPSISLRIQELFGVNDVPAIAMDRVRPKVNILGPNMRPVQVTTDLAGFWVEHYPEIRAALARRYPKHEWR